LAENGCIYLPYKGKGTSPNGANTNQPIRKAVDEISNAYFTWLSCKICVLGQRDIGLDGVGGHRGARNIDDGMMMMSPLKTTKDVSVEWWGWCSVKTMMTQSF